MHARERGSRHAEPDPGAASGDHDMSGRSGCRKEIQHPSVGRLVFEHSTLLMSDAADIRVVFYTPLEEAGTIDKVLRLVDGVE